MASTDSLPVPRKNTAFRFYFWAVNTDGTLNTGAVVSTKKTYGDGAAATTPAAPVQIGATALWYGELTTTEMNYDNVSYEVVWTVATILPILLTFQPQEAGDLRVNTTYWNDVAVLALGVSGGIPLLDTSLNVNANVQQSGTAQAGGAATITLAAGADANNNTYVGNVVAIYSGAGAGQSRSIAGYVGSTKVATVGRNWGTNPDNTSVYKVHGLAVPRVDDNLAVLVSDKTGFSLSAVGVQAIWDALTSTLTTVGSIGKLLVTNIDALISSRTKPADTQAAVTLVTTTTNLTNAPSDSSGVTTLLTRITGAVALASKLTKYIQLLARKDAAIATDNATEVTEINASGGSGAGAFVNTTDAQEALRDRGDAAWTTATGFSGLDEAGVRSAVGLASADLDIQIAAIQADTDNIQTRIPAALTVGGAIKADVQGYSGVTTVDGLSPIEAQRIVMAVLAGVVAGAGGATITFKAVDGSKIRVTAITDTVGNRESLTLDGS